MLGNVSEWVLDRYYNKYDVEADAVGHTSINLLPAMLRLSRGEDFGTPSYLRFASPSSEQPNDEGVETAGLRCANNHLTP